MRIRTISLITTIALVSVLASTVGAGATRTHDRGHCAYRLVPRAEQHGKLIRSRAKFLGCFASFADAVRMGSSGAIHLPVGVDPRNLTQSLLDRNTLAHIRGSVMIGTEYRGQDYAGTSVNYFAPNTCAGTIWEATNLQGNENDEFESGKGFGGCDHNKKFAGPWLAGDSVTCTPNCTGYASVQDQVSSLRWKP